MSRVYDGQGHPVSLGAQLGRGGEGSVFEVVSRPPLVAKIYHRAVDAQRAAKIATMASLGNDRLLRVAAWPLNSLHRESSGPVIGLLMPRLTGYKEIHQLYGPKSRLTEFPNAGWPFLIHTAANVARAFAVMHEHGHVIGDVNPGNVLISDRATVVLIDCDSFQITANGRPYLCEVGVPTHQPPELQELKSFRGVIRTPNHDNFGLAVLTFQLLFMARHPFSGAYLGAGDMALERAIREYRFAYGRRAPSRQMAQPPGSLSLDAVSPPAALLFERAFAPEGTRPGMRPSAREWVAALDQLARQLKPCTRNSAHSFLRGLSSCPWCSIEAQAGTLLFNLAVTTIRQQGTTFNVATVWVQISAVPGPGAAPNLPSPSSLPAQPSTAYQVHARRRRTRGVVAIALVIATALAIAGIPVQGGTGFWTFVGSVVVALTFYNWGVGQARADAQRACALARAQWTSVEQRWSSEAGDQAFRARLRELERARQEHFDLPAQRLKKLKQLESERRQRQIRAFLDKHRLDSAQIDGIGAGRKAMLQSYGIETAADITSAKVLAVPGFGQVLSSSLINWCRSIEKKFVFDPTKGVDPRDIAAVDRDIFVARTRVERTLLDGVAQLSQITRQVTIRRQTLGAEVIQVGNALAQAEADLKAL